MVFGRGRVGFELEFVREKVADALRLRGLWL